MNDINIDNLDNLVNQLQLEADNTVPTEETAIEVISEVVPDME